MADRPQLRVEQAPFGWASVCSTHGYLTMWSDPLWANLDLMGHAAHHHTRPRPHSDPVTPPDARCGYCFQPATSWRNTGTMYVAVCPNHVLLS